MRRFYALTENIKENEVILTDDQAAHIANVLRLKEGEQIIVCDGSGLEYFCTLTAVSSRECRTTILYSKMSENEPHTLVTLFQGIPKGEKMELIVQKCAELGIVNIVPVLTERTVVRLDKKEALKKQERWQKIALEACKQCGRAKVPAVQAPMDFQDAVKLFAEYPLRLLAYEEEQTLGISQALAEMPQKIAYFIGPEGGVAPQEHVALVAAGAKSVTLGKRILRAETAAITLGAVILYQAGEMNG